jgi:hypothetical protein
MGMRWAARAAAVLLGLMLTGCDSTPAAAPPPSPTPTGSSGLDHYTDTGDGCEQAISAIAYADDQLRALGQEPYQEFDDAVRSRLAAVAGTLALEAKDWPASDPLKNRSQAPNRVRTLLRYRIEAGRLILACRDAVPD